MHITHGGRNVGVSHQLFERREVHSRHGHTRSKCVTEIVKSERWYYAGRPQGPLVCLANGCERLVVVSLAGKQERPLCLGEPLPQNVYRGVGQLNTAPCKVCLSVRNKEIRRLEVNVFLADGEHLLGSHSRFHDQGSHIPKQRTGRCHILSLFFVRNNPHLPGPLVKELHVLNGVLGNVLFPHRQVQDQPECCKIPIHRCGRYFGGTSDFESFHQCHRNGIKSQFFKGREQRFRALPIPLERSWMRLILFLGPGKKFVSHKISEVDHWHRCSNTSLALRQSCFTDRFRLLRSNFVC